MSNLLERQSRRFQNGAGIKNAAGHAVLSVALQGTTTTMPALGAIPTVWKTGMSAPDKAKFDSLYASIGVLRNHMTTLGLDAHPANLSATITANASEFTANVMPLSYLRAGGGTLERKSIQLARGVRLKNAGGSDVLGGALIASFEAGDGLTDDVAQEATCPTQDFTGVTGNSDLDDYLTALSAMVSQQLTALRFNNLLNLS